MKNATIEPLTIPQQKLDELKAVLADPKLPNLHKSSMIRKLTGACHSCGQMAEQIVKYRRYGAIVVEKYCDECLERMKI